MDGAVERVISKRMTLMAGLFPIMSGTGTDSEVVKRIAPPMGCGMGASTILIFVLIPAIYILWKGWWLSVKTF